MLSVAVKSLMIVLEKQSGSQDKIMLYHILLSLLLTVSSISTDRCHLNWSCSALNSRFVLAHLSNISSEAQCRTKCREDQQCNYFTFYNSSSPGLLTFISSSLTRAMFRSGRHLPSLHSLCEEARL